MSKKPIDIDFSKGRSDVPGRSLPCLQNNNWSLPTILTISGLTLVAVILVVIFICRLCCNYRKTSASKASIDVGYPQRLKLTPCPVQYQSLRTTAEMSTLLNSTRSLFTFPPLVKHTSLPCLANGQTAGYGWAGGQTGTSENTPIGVSSPSVASSEASPQIHTSFGLVNPMLYTSEEAEDFPTGPLGRIWYNVSYDCQNERLVVSLLRVRNLPTKDKRGSMPMISSFSCDAFVRVFLLPDEKRYQQSRTQRKTRDPAFYEDLVFPIPYSALQARTLRLTVCDADRFMKNAVIGHVLFPLANLDITTTTELSGDLEKNPKVAYEMGEVLVSLCYIKKTETLEVGIIKASNLKKDPKETLEPYLKVSISTPTRMIKKKRSPVVKGGGDSPVFDQMLSFRIHETDLSSACLEVKLRNSSSGAFKHDRNLGRVVLGGMMYSRGSDLEHWNLMMTQYSTTTKAWHNLIN